jgi:chemotaxis response regulator CheB
MQEITNPAKETATCSQFCPVVGFEASAGGLEAFSDVLHHLPVDTGLAMSRRIARCGRN